MTPAKQALRHSTLASRYRLVRVLGAGGTATVWEAIDLGLRRKVAVKILHPHLLPDDASRRRLEAEARAAASLSHSAIVRVHDILVLEEAVAIVLELVDGVPLAELRARRGPLPASEAVWIGRQIAAALDHAHRAGILHRDVKPGNILLGRDGRARLVDFGIARAFADSGASVTVTGPVMGTLRYMAPEQLAGRPAGPPADVFSLGAVLFEMLVGVPAFDASNPVALVRAHEGAPPRVPGVPPGLERIVQSALDPDLDRRPARAATLGSALADWQAGPITSHGSEAPRSGSTAAARRTGSRLSVVAGAAAAVALIVAGVLGADLAGLGDGASTPGGAAVPPSVLPLPPDASPIIQTPPPMATPSARPPATPAAPPATTVTPDPTRQPAAETRQPTAETGQPAAETRSAVSPASRPGEGGAGKENRGRDEAGPGRQSDDRGQGKGKGKGAGKGRDRDDD